MNNSTGIPRPLLACLVFSLPVLIVAFAVVAAGYLLTAGGTDPGAAQALQIAGVVLMMLVTIDVILLVGVLGLSALADFTRPTDSSGTSERHVDQE